MSEFEQLKSTIDTLAEEHGLTKLTLQWVGHVGVYSCWTEDCVDLNVYIESDDLDGEWRHSQRGASMTAGLEAFVHKAVAKFINERESLKAEAIAKAKAFLAAAGE